MSLDGNILWGSSYPKLLPITPSTDSLAEPADEEMSRDLFGHFWGLWAD